MGTKAPVTSPAAQVRNQLPVDVEKVYEDIETVKGVIAFLMDIGNTGVFSRADGLGISPEGEVGLTFILHSTFKELDKISNCCAPNL